jgi:predicted PurR-regulated permease PerM
MDINQALQTITYTLIVALLPVLVGYFITLIKAKRDILTQKIDNTYIKNTINEATDIIFKVVGQVSQQYVDDLKSIGKFNEAEQKIALEKAITQAKDLMSNDMINLLIQKYGDINIYIETIIESYIKSTKKVSLNK